jgi:hypothetical protein
MRRSLTLAGSFLFCILSVTAQEYKDVAGIFYARCTSCHHTGAHNLPFMDYTQTAKVAVLIQGVLVSGVMPPWNADTAYTRFQHERIITLSEKQKILDWIDNGVQKGDTTLAPAAPSYTSPYEIAQEADLTLGIGQFTSTSTLSDKYYCFSIPTNLAEDRIIRAFEVVPGNKSIVHHAVITADTTGNYQGDLSGSCYNVGGNLGLGAYAPGTKATVFPAEFPLKAGIYLKAGSKLIIQLHYPKGSAGQVDSTKIRLFFYPPGEFGVRRIMSVTPLQNWTMTIPANSVTTHSAYFPSPSAGIPFPVSIYAMMPHSHLLCTSILNYAYSPGIDTIPLVRINHWDFEWQDYYFFRKLQKIPAGYRLFAQHVFDNTTNNHHNPNSPPQNVFAGTDTDDEMLFDGVLYLEYQPGDENIDVEAIIERDPLLWLPKHQRRKFERPVVVFPNPFNDRVMFRIAVPAPARLRIEIFNTVGQTVHAKTLVPGQRDLVTYFWEAEAGQTIPPGIYLYRVQIGDTMWSGRLIRN